MTQATSAKAWIQTRHGGRFNLLDPGARDIHYKDIAASLSKLCRFTGHVSEFYSVAQHSVLVSLLVPPDDALWGLMHDAAEAYLGDIATPLKNLLPDYKAIEARVEACVFAAEGLTGSMPPSVKQADLRLLAAEKLALLPGSEEWELLAGVRPAPFAITPCWSPQHAEEMFIRRYDFLWR